MYNSFFSKEVWYFSITEFLGIISSKLLDIDTKWSRIVFLTLYEEEYGVEIKSLMSMSQR